MPSREPHLESQLVFPASFWGGPQNRRAIGGPRRMRRYYLALYVVANAGWFNKYLAPYMPPERKHNGL